MNSSTQVKKAENTKMGLFGKDKKADPKEQVNEWSKKIRKERNQLDRQIRQIQRSEAQAVASIKQAAKKNDPDSAKVSFALKELEIA